MLVKEFLINNDIGNYEIIVVNVGSTSTETEFALHEIGNLDEKIIVVEYSNNQGKGFAVNTGIKKAKYSKVIFMDADLSTDLSAITTTINLLDTNDMVIASRHNKDSCLEKKQGPIRIFIGFCCRKLTMLFTGLNYTDTQCGFKGFTYDCAKQLAAYQKIKRFAFDIEYIYLAKMLGYKIVEISAKWRNNPNSSVKIIKDSLCFLRDLLLIKRIHKSKDLCQKNVKK